tara:strand:- start:1195 stop:1425 length:231 start_codon:yes stop_codon:yes gene_type:complete
MKIPLNLLNEILETVRQNVGIGSFREGESHKFAVPPAPTEVKDTYLYQVKNTYRYQEVVVYFDYREGWVLDTKEQE